jgi:uncharacterized protein with HEPN domain
LTRDPAAYLADMLEHAQDVRSFVAGMGEEAFLADRKTVFAVLRALEVIGEAARRVAPEITARHPEIPWREIIGMRNIIAHDYLGLKLSRVFVTATTFVPELIAKLPAIIAETEA